MLKSLFPVLAAGGNGGKGVNIILCRRETMGALPLATRVSPSRVSRSPPLASSGLERAQHDARPRLPVSAQALLVRHLGECNSPMTADQDPN
jgi:hypothetical protein